MCGTALEAKLEAYWNGPSRTATCLICAEPERAAGTAGASAQRIADRRRARREEAVNSRFPRIGKYILALTPEAQSTTAWATGARGERKLAKWLDGAASPTVRVMHDRRIPGSRANIDHIVVARAGVFVIDAKAYSGTVHRRDVGGFFRRDDRLYVGRRDCTKLVHGMQRQVEAVRPTLPEWFDGEVAPVLCFVGAEWKLFSKPFIIGNVLVTWPRALVDLVGKPGPLAEEGIASIARDLAVKLPA